MNKITTFDVVAWLCTKLSARLSFEVCSWLPQNSPWLPVETPPLVWPCLGQFSHLFPASMFIPQGWDTSGFILRGEDSIHIPWRGRILSSHPHTQQENFCQRWFCSWCGALVRREGHLQQKSLPHF